MHDILGKVKIVPGKGTSHIVIPLPKALGQLPEPWDDLLVAALPSSVGTHPVIDLLTSVKAQHHIAHLPVQEFHDFIV